MANFTSNTYQMKQKILTFTNKFSKHLSKPEKKFTADITYGMLASGSCLLTDVVVQLHKPSKKINIVNRLSRHLAKGTPASAATVYLQQVKKCCLLNQSFISMTAMLLNRMVINLKLLASSGTVPKAHLQKMFTKKGYHVTEACVLTSRNHPVSIFFKDTFLF